MRRCTTASAWFDSERAAWNRERSCYNLAESIPRKKKQFGNRRPRTPVFQARQSEVCTRRELLLVVPSRAKAQLRTRHWRSVYSMGGVNKVAPLSVEGEPPPETVDLHIPAEGRPEVDEKGPLIYHDGERSVTLACLPRN